MLLTLHIDSSLRKRIVFQISQRVIEIAFPFAHVEPCAEPGALSLKNIDAASKAVTQTLSVQPVGRINLCKIHLFPQMVVSACATVSIDLESFRNHSPSKSGLLMGKMILLQLHKSRVVLIGRFKIASGHLHLLPKKKKKSSLVPFIQIHSKNIRINSAESSHHFSFMMSCQTGRSVPQSDIKVDSEEGGNG